MPVVLYNRQKQAYDFIKQYIERNGFSPTLREVADSMGLSSLATIHEHISRLVEKGVVKRYPGSRGLEIIGEVGEKLDLNITVSVTGYISAGLPLEPYINRTTVFKIAPHMISGKHRAYMLEVRGNGLMDDAIAEGDYVLVEEVFELMNGEIGLVLLENETVALKRYFKEATRVRLEATRANMEAMYVPDVKIIGRVAGIIRKF